jgi:glycosyltransferase involved in cell wall biosynthesis
MPPDSSPAEPEGGVRRVLMTADTVGGVWTYALALARALGERGVAVDLATMGPPPSGDQRREAAGAGVRLFESDFSLEWMEQCWEDVDRAAGWLLDLEQRCQPDVVHLNGFCHAVLPWRAPAIVVAHSCVLSWWRAVHGVEAPACWSEYRARVQRGLHSPAYVIAPTNAMRAALDAEYGAVGNVRVIANGLPLEPRQDLPREPIVFAAGRVWDEAKNVGALCAIAGQLRWPLYIAGALGADAPDRCEGTATRYLGRLSAAAIRTWYAQASIYALPARYEPFGLSILEAAAAGCALVLGDISSLRENWNGAAMFVEPDDHAGLVFAINRLADDPALRRELSERARVRAGEFRIARTADRYVEVYNAACATRAAQRASA